MKRTNQGGLREMRPSLRTANCRLQTAMQMSEAISVAYIEINYYQFLAVTISLGRLYINPFSWIEWHIEKQFSTKRVHPFLLSCSYQLPLTPSLFFLFLCFSFFFIIKNMRNNNIIRIEREGDRSLVQNVEWVWASTRHYRTVCLSVIRFAKQQSI